MSSFRDGQIDEPGLLPPPSAQPRPSVFGGPSSDADLQPSSQPEPPRRSLFGGPFAQYASLHPVSEADPMDEAHDQVENEPEMLMRESPIVPRDDSNNGDFDEESRGRTLRRSAKPTQPQREEIHYVIDRGLDLPPGVERPNIFTGDARTWRHYNSDEIGAYNAILTNRSRDLAAHLYNVHVLRKRTRGISRRILDADDAAPPAVHKRWAAWPIHASKVPRVDEFLQQRLERPEILQMAPDPRSSARLEQCITAAMLKASKERFAVREWDYEEIKDDPERIMNLGGGLMADELKKDEEEENEQPIDTRILEPIIKLDDDEAFHQVRPLVRNVISQVDQLLHGLHCAMKGRKYEDDSEDEDSSGSDAQHDSNEEDDREEADGESRSRSRSRGRQQERQGSQEREASRRSDSHSLHTSSGEETDEESHRGRSQSRDQSQDPSKVRISNRHIKGRLKLRDWSEIVGVASIMGIPAPAVMRASKRCADLFGEDIEFRTLAEGRVRKKRNTTGLEEYAYTESESQSQSERDEASDSGSDIALPSLPPILPVPQRTATPENEPNADKRKPGQRRSKSNLTPAIVPPSESPSPPPEGRTESEPAAGAADQPTEETRAVKAGVGKGSHRKSDIVCPVTTCIRHTNGFSRKWNLNLHLKRCHMVNNAAGEAMNGQPGDGDVIMLE